MGSRLFVYIKYDQYPWQVTIYHLASQPARLWSSSINRHIAFRSPILDEACRTLMLNRDVPGDRRLVALARILKVATEAAKVVRHIAEKNKEMSYALFQVKPLREMLEQIENELDQEERRCRKSNEPVFLVSFRSNEKPSATVQGCLHSKLALVWEVMFHAHIIC